MDDDAPDRAALLVTVPALLLSVPVWAVSTAMFLVWREAFGQALEWMATCPLLPAGEDDEDEAAA